MDAKAYPTLTMPVAALHFPGHTDLLDSLAARAARVTAVEIADCGHYLAEEQPEIVAAALHEFFG